MIPREAQVVIEALHLVPHPREGGYFIETLREATPVTVRGESRSRATAIYFLVLAGAPTELHRLPGDELFHHYLGEPLELFLYDGERGAQHETLGDRLDLGMCPQILVPGGVWQAAKVVKPGGFALVGTTMSPGFDFRDYEGVDRESWAVSHPDGRRAMEAFYLDQL